MKSVARSSPPVSVVSDFINQSRQSVASSSSQVTVVSGVISPSIRSVDHSMGLLNPPVSEEKQKKSQSARFYGDYDADSSRAMPSASWDGRRKQQTGEIS